MLRLWTWRSPGRSVSTVYLSGTLYMLIGLISMMLHGQHWRTCRHGGHQRKQVALDDLERCECHHMLQCPLSGQIGLQLRL